MYHPTTRLLSILELLQSRGEMNAHELSQAIEVEERSIRRYILMLRDMGIPIEGARGRHGGYTLRPGYRLTPLMFNGDEITAVVMGLMQMREIGTLPPLAVESATAKIERVLPDELRRRVDALRNQLVMDDALPGGRTASSEWISRISIAAYEGRCLKIEYISANGDVTQRVISPYGLILHMRTWYLPAYCHLRRDERVFRLDRVRSVAETEQRFAPPVDFDMREFVIASVARLPGIYTFEVMLHMPLEIVRDLLPPTLALLEPVGDQTLLRCYTDDADWLARLLVRTGVKFTVLESDVLRDALRSIADELMASIEQV